MTIDHQDPFQRISMSKLS